MPRTDLVPDCGSCAAICCIAPSFDSSDDFAHDKAAGSRCHYLQRDARCAIHAELMIRGYAGYAGYAIYNCYGAGQRVTLAFAAMPHSHADARTSTRAQMNEAFLIVRVLHELLWLFSEALKLCPPARRALADELARAIEELDTLSFAPLHA